MNTMQLTLASRYLMGRKLRTTLTTLAIVFGVMILFSMNAMIPMMARSLRQNMLAAAGEVDLTVTGITDGTFLPNVVDDVRGVSGIDAATGSLRQNVQLPRGAVISAVTVAGLDVESAQDVRMYRIVDGRFLEPGDAQVMVVSERLADVVDLEVGDTFTLPAASGTMDFEIIGQIESPALPGVVEEVYVPLETAQQLSNQPGRINTIDAVFTYGAARRDIEAAVAERLGDQYKLGQLDATRALTANLELASVVVNLFGMVALIMGGFIIYITFRTIVVERRRDIGMLRAVGASRRTVVAVILVESLLQGIIGTALGLLLGYGFTLVMLAALTPIFEDMLKMQPADPVYSAGSFAISIGLGMGVTLIGGLFPALSATRVTPLEALRPVVAEVYDRAAGRGAVLGAVLMVLGALGLLVGSSGLAGLGFVLFIAGMVLVGPAIVKPIATIFGTLLALAFAREGQIAQGNMTRQPGRAAVTATVMMIGLALIVALAGMVSSLQAGFMRFIDVSMGADFILMPQSLVLSAGNIGADPALAQQIGDLEGVDAVATIRMSSSVTGETPIQMVGINPQTYSQITGLEFSEGEPEAVFASLDEGRAVVVNGIFAAQSGLTVGDTLNVKTPEGDQDYHIVGIGNDYLNAKIATAYISQANLERDFHQTSDILIMVEPAPDADRGEIRRQLNTLLADYPAFSLFSFLEFRESQMRTFKQMLGMLYALGIALAIPSLIALMNTQAINVMERTREIGMVRAVGATKRQIRRIILAETLLLAATGTAFGIIAGLWLSYVIVSSLGALGFELTFYFPATGALVALAVGLIFGVIAALIPARQAANLQIVQALRYE